MKSKEIDHYVSPESPQHEPVPVDENHSEVVEAHGEIHPGVTKDQTVRKHEQADGEPELGGEDGRKVTTSKATLGRHVKSDSGMKVAARRHSHIKMTRATREKENFGSKK